MHHTRHRVYAAWLLAWLATAQAAPQSPPSLTLTPANAQICEASTRISAEPPPAAAQRLAGSQITQGSHDIAWAWLSESTSRYPHGALGSGEHAGTLNVLVRTPGQHPNAPLRHLTHRLPDHLVFEDRWVRLVDLDKDGRDEVVVIQAHRQLGAALVVFGLQDGQLVEKAKSPHIGSPNRWMNPVGFGDFEGQGQTGIASITTPHIGGVLTLYRYRPPHVLPYATLSDTSNHAYGKLEQHLSRVVAATLPKTPDSLLVPDMQRTTLQWLRWETAASGGKWTVLASSQTLPASIARMTQPPDTPCIQLANGAWWRIGPSP